MLNFQVMSQFIKKMTQKKGKLIKIIFFCFDFRMKYELDMFVKLPINNRNYSKKRQKNLFIFLFFGLILKPSIPVDFLSAIKVHISLIHTHTQTHTLHHQSIHFCFPTIQQHRDLKDAGFLCISVLLLGQPMNICGLCKCAASFIFPNSVIDLLEKKNSNSNNSFKTVLCPWVMVSINHNYANTFIRERCKNHLCRQNKL